MDIQFGLENEIGITRERPEGIDVVAESIALVRSATVPGVRSCWDYGREDPHRDARGFRVAALRQDTDEANYFAQDASRALRKLPGFLRIEAISHPGEQLPDSETR